MSTDQIPEHDVRLPAAERYANAVTVAAAAQAKLDALTEQIKDHEWHRQQAEMQADALREQIQLDGHRLILSTDAEPAFEVTTLLSLYGGQVWVRAKRHDGSLDPNYWVRADMGGNPTHFEWPIEDMGPFIVLPDADWYIRRVVDEARRRHDDERAARSKIYSFPGYRADDDGAWSEPPLAEALERVIHALQEKCTEADRKRYAAEQAADQLRTRVERQLAEPYDLLEVEHDDGTVERVEVVTVDAIRTAIGGDQS